MIEKLTSEFWQFVEDNMAASPEALRLKYHRASDGSGIDYPLAITQIECRQKYGSKLRETLSRCPRFLFPTRLSGEQCTSDALAVSHAHLIGSARSVIDLTSGLGIDALHLANEGVAVTAVEIRPELAEALEYNARAMGVESLRVICGDCTELLASGGLRKADAAFIDPARRAADGSRIFAVSDCQPDVVAMLPEVSRLVKRMVIKLSPMLDLTAVEKQLSPFITDIYAFGTRTECKELVAILSFAEEHDEMSTDNVIRHAVTILPDGTEISLNDSERVTDNVLIGTPKAGSYIYEPYPAVMKAALWNVLAQRFPGLRKMADNTHVFWSAERIAEFPGQCYRLDEIVPWMSKHIKRLSSRIPVAEVAVRNFGMTAQALATKLQIKSGGQCRILGVTDSNGTRMLLVLSKSDFLLHKP